ncbi:hypothetical protein BH10BAC5_BH10BAC5_07170 [soil metagenome]
MKEKQIKANVEMLFTAGKDWHLDIFLEANAQVTDLKMRTLSKVSKNVFSINYYSIIQNGDQTQIPIDVSEIGHSTGKENVHLKYEITYNY